MDARHNLNVQQISIGYPDSKLMAVVSISCGRSLNHGKRYCHPEGGTLKNSGRQHELHIKESAEQLKDSAAFYNCAKYLSGLATPCKTLHHKKGKGIYRRFFYWIPSKGTGAVDRSRLPKFTAEGTSKLHEFVDIGVAGVCSTRRAS